MDTKYIMVKTKSWECMAYCIYVLEMVIQGRSFAMLKWQRKIALSYTKRYAGNTPFCYIIHTETHNYRRRTGTGKETELNKALL